MMFSSAMNSMFVDFNQPFYYPGNEVRGTIYVNIATAFPAEGVSLVIKTKEFVKYKDWETQSVQRERRNPNTNEMETVTVQEQVEVTREDKKTLFKNKTFIPVWQSQMINIGQFAFPFCFKVPDNLPGSFEYYDDEVIAYISYTMKSKIVNMNDSRDKIKFTNLIIVRQNEKMLECKNELHSNYMLTTWGCCNQGNVTFDVHYPKNYFYPGENVDVRMKLNNTQCQLNANSLNVTASQEITVQCKGKNRRTFRRTIGRRELNEVIAGGQEKENTFTIAIKDEDNPTLKHLNKSKHYKLFQSEDIISKLQASCTGRNIQCKYFLTAYAGYDGCCPSNPSFKIPILLYIPENTHPLQFIQPAGWNPQMMDSVDVAYSSADYQAQDPNDMGFSSNMGMGTGMDQGFSSGAVPATSSSAEMNNQYSSGYNAPLIENK